MLYNEQYIIVINHRIPTTTVFQPPYSDHRIPSRYSDHRIPTTTVFQPICSDHRIPTTVYSNHDRISTTLFRSPYSDHSTPTTLLHPAHSENALLCCYTAPVFSALAVFNRPLSWIEWVSLLRSPLLYTRVLVWNTDSSRVEFGAVVGAIVCSTLEKQHLQLQWTKYIVWNASQYRNISVFPDPFM